MYHLGVSPKRKKRWRKAAGVEPTRERLTPPTGFEARPRHRARLPSFESRVEAATLVEDKTVIVASNPAADDKQHVKAAYPGLF